MAFILQSLRGISGLDKDESKNCDVLWFPTGGGKTESYLGLSIFAIGFRRLTKIDEFSFTYSWLENDAISWKLFSKKILKKTNKK